MKTTIEIDDALLIEAKAVAARRRTTLKDMITRSLRRELGLCATLEIGADGPFETGPLGLPVLKKSRGAAVDAEQVQAITAAMDDEALRQAMALREGAAP